jgi:hypothetical protein
LKHNAGLYDKQGVKDEAHLLLQWCCQWQQLWGCWQHHLLEQRRWAPPHCPSQHQKRPANKVVDSIVQHVSTWV